MAITAAQIISLTDKLTAYYLNVKTGFGTSSGSAACKKASDALDIIIGTGSAYSLANYPAISLLAAPANNLLTASDQDAVAGGYLSPIMSALDQVCAAYGVSQSIGAITNLETFCTYYNVTDATKWACLLAPDFRDAWLAWRTTAAPTAYDFYFEILQGSTYTNALRKVVIVTGTPTQTAGTNIDSTKYAGGYGQVKVSGFAGSSDTVTVTGLWRKTDGTTHSANGTATVTTDATVVLTPPAADELLITCTAVTAGANITGATIYVEAKRPTGRTNPPT